MGLVDWIGDKWGEFVSASPFGREHRESFKESNPFKKENRKVSEDFFAAPREGFFTPKTPAQTVRDINDRAAGARGDYFGAPGPVFNPAQASRATQRYLRAAGGKAPYAPLTNQDAGDFGVTEFTEIAPHRYTLSNWQQQQAELDYGVEAPEERVQLSGDSFRTGRMSQDAYDALTPQQRNAIRFNDLLMDAVQKDRAASKEGADMATYRTDVAEMFGTQGGSRTYAPNTMALLKGLGVGQLRNQDLDEYLSLDRAYDVDEIRNLQPWEGETPGYINEGFGKATSRETASGLDRLQIDTAGKLIERALADTNVLGWSEDARIAKHLGQQIPVSSVPTGWLFHDDEQFIVDSRGGPDSDAANEEIFYQRAYDSLRNNQTQTLDDFWIATEDFAFTDEDYAKIFDYFYQRSLEDDRVGVTDPQYRTGQQVRDFIGIG